MKKQTSVTSILITLFLITICFAGGTYNIGQDHGGIYIQTDNDGEWYIDKSDLKKFKVGQTGTYMTGIDKDGTYLVIDGKQKFYINTNTKETNETQGPVPSRKALAKTKVRPGDKVTLIKPLEDGITYHVRTPYGIEVWRDRDLYIFGAYEETCTVLEVNADRNEVLLRVPLMNTNYWFTIM